MFIVWSSFRNVYSPADFVCESLVIGILQQQTLLLINKGQLLDNEKDNVDLVHVLPSRHMTSE